MNSNTLPFPYVRVMEENDVVEKSNIASVYVDMSGREDKVRFVMRVSEIERVLDETEMSEGRSV